MLKVVCLAAGLFSLRLALHSPFLILFLIKISRSFKILFSLFFSFSFFFIVTTMKVCKRLLSVLANLGSLPLSKLYDGFLSPLTKTMCFLTKSECKRLLVRCTEFKLPVIKKILHSRYI